MVHIGKISYESFFSFLFFSSAVEQLTQTHVFLCHSQQPGLTVLVLKPSTKSLKLSSVKIIDGIDSPCLSYVYTFCKHVLAQLFSSLSSNMCSSIFIFLSVFHSLYFYHTVLSSHLQRFPRRALCIFSSDRTPFVMSILREVHVAFVPPRLPEVSSKLPLKRFPLLVE